MHRRLVAAGALRSEVDDELADKQPFERRMRAAQDGVDPARSPAGRTAW
jgi:hypothetical protein